MKALIMLFITHVHVYCDITAESRNSGTKGQAAAALQWHSKQWQ
jgi:hypothetical protein